MLLLVLLYEADYPAILLLVLLYEADCSLGAILVLSSLSYTLDPILVAPTGCGKQMWRRRDGGNEMGVGAPPLVVKALEDTYSPGGMGMDSMPAPSP